MRKSKRTTLKGSYLEQRFIIPRVLFLSVGNVFSRWDTRRNCDGAECTSAMLCGIIDKHPNDKAVRRNLSQQVTKCETELANLQSDYNSKLSAYKTVEDSFARKIEADIVASNPDRYIVNGVKNWALLNKHVALLQKRCNGKLPPRHSVVNL